MVFLAWVLIFYHSGESQNIKALTDSDMLKDDVFKGLITALPIGVIIHQISVSIKNHLVGKICKELDDIPREKHIENLKKKDNEEYTKHILERISNLNSFYYVRFDNGFLAPFLALIVVLSSGHQVSFIAVAIAIGLGYIMLYYIKRICEELKEYFSMLEPKSSIEKFTKSHKDNQPLEISKFLGIKIFMFFSEHNPPHFHVKYNDYESLIDINTFGVIEGRLPAKMFGLVIEWAEEHQEELLKNWDNIKEGGDWTKIEPLV